MPKVHRKDDVTSGHGCFPPTIPATYSPDVFAFGGIPVVRNGDTTVEHCCGSDCHSGVYIGEKCPVFANEKYIQLVGDPIDCGDFVDTHDPVWDCCSEPVDIVKPKIQVFPLSIDFGTRIIDNSEPTKISFEGMTSAISGALEQIDIPVVITNVGGPVLIIQFAKYGPINPQQKNIGCDPVNGKSADEYPDFIFKNVCWPITIMPGEIKTFTVNFIPKTIGPKLMYIEINSVPDQEIQRIIFKGTGIEDPTP